MYYFAIEFFTILCVRLATGALYCMATRVHAEVCLGSKVDERAKQTDRHTYIQAGIQTDRQADILEVRDAER